MDGIPPERVVTDSWPALHGRPVLRRTVAVGLVLCVSAGAAMIVRGVNALTVGRVGRETDRDRAERLAGLHPSQHPGAGRYYVPVGAVYTLTSDGSPVAYLHYRLGGGKEPGLGDFLRTYDLPAPGPAAPLPPDLAAALGGDEPAEAPELPEEPTAVPASPGTPSGSAAGPSVPAPSVPAASVPAPEPTAAPAAVAAEPTPTDADPDGVDGDADGAQGGAQDAGADAGAGGGVRTGGAAHVPADTAEGGTPDPVPTPTWTPTASPSAVPTHAPTARRIYVATIPGGLPGAADIYIRATG
ncbi:hypothetical protein ABTY61_22030 [Kitasatospora sp. NPDC096128]|uniref:hypothetical protein n=1 Tax=Kitasatospora sp. NPDC096128 TaxID=3155547 RepID=UPI00332BC7C6